MPCRWPHGQHRSVKSYRGRYHRLLDAVPSQDLAVGLGGVLGGFRWSSQRLDRGGCGDYSKAAFGSVRAGRAAVAGPAPRGAARGSAAVLGGGRGGTRERGRRRRGGVARRRGAVVPAGGRHATFPSLAVEAGVGPLLVVRGAGGARAPAGA